jgi:uncharacterized protein (TIGR03118 family)
MPARAECRACARLARAGGAVVIAIGPCLCHTQSLRSAGAASASDLSQSLGDMMDRGRFFAGSLLVLLGALAGLVRAADDNNYLVTVLVSNVSGQAPVTDPKLVNGWGIAATGTSPWWVSNNGTDSSTLYNGTGGKLATEVTVPGGPTGMVANSNTTAFLLAPSRPARFMWASEDGTLSGWNPQFNATLAKVVFTSAGSIYKGLAILGTTLYTTDFAECKVETIDGSFNAFDSVGGFEDPSIPDHYCPFGIQAIGGSIFVTYALRGGVDDVAGVSHGVVREFDAAGNLVAEVADHGLLNSPWGLAWAPANFGKFSGCLLVGNFGDGRINAYCEEKNKFHHRGTLKSPHGGDISIDGLWGIGFGNGSGSGPTNVLYFAAGPDEESNGLFGKIEFME